MGTGQEPSLPHREGGGLADLRDDDRGVARVHVHYCLSCSRRASRRGREWIDTTHDSRVPIFPAWPCARLYAARIERVKCRIECGITRTDILQGPGMGSTVGGPRGSGPGPPRPGSGRVGAGALRGPRTVRERTRHGNPWRRRRLRGGRPTCVMTPIGLEAASWYQRRFARRASHDQPA